MALADHLFAVVTAEASAALTSVGSVIIEADSAVLARVARALVDVPLAQIPGVASLTAVARKSADFVDADAVILARIRLAIVEIRLAPAAEEAIQAVTLVGFTVRRNTARPVIQARILLAQWMRLNGRLAKCSGEFICAETFVVANAIFFAGPAVATRVLLTRRAQIAVAVLSAVPRGAMTLVLVRLRCALTVHAREVQAVINELPDENVMLGIADARREWTRSEHHAFDRDFCVVER